ncbi:MAG: competence/damage-inducible protein A [Candidatus Riflebacteria bacterium]|nr:competence/damage-inducible protein A [Candidatus Riflebacteria bacterium]
MNKTILAEIISVGTELLLGEIIDTNAAFLAEKLRDKGIFVYRKSTVGDNILRLTTAIKEAMQRADLIIIGGGLGPTEDDMTREAIASVVNEKPFIDDQLFENLRQMFVARGREMTENNHKQAWLIESAIALPNPVGTAAGWFVTFDEKMIVALPGPPHELKKMWHEQVESRLPISDQFIYHRTIHTAGIGESDLAARIGQFTNMESPGIGTYARNSGVDVRIAAVAPSIEQAKAIADSVIMEIEAILAPWIFGYDDETLVSAIMKQLTAAGQTFSCVESVTGGNLAAEITDCPGISSCFKGSLTAYTNDVKIRAGVAEELIREHGVVSEQVVLAMAETARKMFNADWGLATTGVAGPDGLEGKKPGTAWIAVVGPNLEWSQLVDWPGSRQMVKNRICRIVFQSFFKLLKEAKCR